MSTGPDLRLTDRRLRILGGPFRRSIVTLTAVRAGLGGTRIVQALLAASVLGHVLHRRGAIGPEVVAIAACGLVRLALVWVRDRQARTTAARVRGALRGRLYGRLVELGPGFTASERTGGLETVLVAATDRVGAYFADFVPQACATALTVALALGWVVILDPLSGLAMVLAALLVPAAPVLTARAFGESGRRFADGLGRLTSDYLDAVQGMATLKAFNAATRWGGGLAERAEDLAAETTSLAGLATMHVGFVSLGMAAGSVLGVALATIRTVHHATAAAGLLAIVLLAREAFAALHDLQAAFPSAYDAVARANAMFDVLDAVSPAPEPLEPVTAMGRRPSVTFERVRFSYRLDGPPTLDDVSFTVEAGETVAIVGPSGAGKTTLVSLLLRFFDPASGTIRVGGADIRALALADLRSLVAVTFQDSYLFHRSVAENIRLGRPDAGSAEVEAAARGANAHDFIAALPDGYQTVIHERGHRLSGGQRQRLAIARALLSAAPILVFDEPTSSVDAQSELLITDALSRLGGDRTVILIAHRLSTVARADRIVVMEDGRVVEMGSPAQLRAAAGPFARLVQAQS